MTARQVILSALRIIGAIKTGEAPTGDMFENAREILNDMLALWSAEELMPFDITQTELDLFAGVPNYTINNGAELDANGICLTQTPSGAGDLTINGALATSGVATLDVPRHIIITSTANDSARTFTITGTNAYGDATSEAITGPNTTTVRGYKQFKTVTQVAISGAATGSIVVGTDWILSCRRPIQIVDSFIRDSSGNDSPLFPVTHDRYTEIRDKDEAGVSTKFYYRQSYPSSEVYVHPVPSTGIALTVNTELEHITNGAFDSSTGWTLGNDWSISGGVLTHIASVLPSYAFTTTNESWTSDVPGAFYWSGLYGGTLRHDAGNSTFTAKSPNLNLIPGDTYTVTFRAYKIGHLSSYGNLTCTPSLGGTAGTIVGPLPEDVSRPNYIDVSQSIVAGSSDDKLQIVFNGVIGTLNYPGALIDTVMISGQLVGSSASQLTADLAVALVTGDTYHVTYDVTGYTGGSCTPALGNANGSAISANGSYSTYITCGAGTDFDLDASSDFEASLDNVSVINLPYDTLAPIDYRLFLDCWLPFVEIGTDDIDTEINLPGAYIMAMRWGLAVELTPDYGKEVSPFVYLRSKEYLDAIRFSNTRLPKPTILNWPLPTVNQQPAINRN